MSCEKTSTFTSALERATELRRRGFVRGAIDVLEVELRQNSDEGKLWQLRAELLCEQGNYAAALDNIERAQLLIPLSLQGQLVHAQCMARQGHEQLAGEVLQGLASQSGLEPCFALAVQRELEALGYWPEAALICRRILTSTPDDDRALFALANALLRMGQPSEAVVPLLRRAVYLAPHVERYRIALVVQLLEQRRCDQAYLELQQLPVAELQHVCCRGCLRRLLELAVMHGDAPRAALFASQLARLAPPTTSPHRSEIDD